MGIYIWNDCGRGAAEIDREFYFLDTRSHALTYTAKRKAHWGYRPRSFDRLGFACNHLRWRLYNLCAIGSARNGLFFALREQNMCLNWKGNRLLPRSVTNSSERSVLEGSFVLQRCLIVLLGKRSELFVLQHIGVRLLKQNVNWAWWWGAAAVFYPVGEEWLRFDPEWRQKLRRRPTNRMVCGMLASMCKILRHSRFAKSGFLVKFQQSTEHSLRSIGIKVDLSPPKASITLIINIVSFTWLYIDLFSPLGRPMTCSIVQTIIEHWLSYARLIYPINVI